MAGFADGFRSGFGLISDVKDRQLYKERLDEQARQGDLDREATSLYRNNQIENAAEQNRLKKIEIDNKQKNEDEILRIRGLEAKNDETRLTNQGTRITAQSGLDDARAKALNQTTQDDADRKSNIEKETQFAVSANAYIEHLKTGKRASARNEEWNAKADRLFSESMGGLTNPFNAVNPATQENMVAFRDVLTATQNGQEANRDSVTDVLNTMLGSNNARQVGTELTSNTTPAAGHLNDKGWKIVSKQVAPDWNIANGQFVGTVDVTVQNAAGDTAVYNAPLSFRRSGVMQDKDGNPVTDEDTGAVRQSAAQPIAVEDLIKSAAGYFKYAQYAGQFEDEIAQSATRLYDLQNGKGALDKAVNYRMSKFQTDMGSGSRASEQSFVKGMTNAELALDAIKLEKYMTFAVLDPAKNIAPPTSSANMMIDRVSKLNEVRTLESDIGRNLTRSELLRASHYHTLDENKKIEVVNREDKKPWELWKRTLKEKELGVETGEPKIRGSLSEEQLRGRFASGFKQRSIYSGGLSGNLKEERSEDMSMYRADGSKKSARGFLGPVTNKVSGGSMTEFSTEMQWQGKKIEIPTMVPTLSDSEIEYMSNMKEGQGWDLSGSEIDRTIINKARKHARERLEKGLSPFYQDGE